jgi:hypothetical protein
MAFHANGGLFFQNRPDGSVWVEKRVPLTDQADDHTGTGLAAVTEHWELSADDWQSVADYVAAAKP